MATANLERLADEAATIAAEKAREFEVQAAALGALVGTDQAPGHVRYQHTAAKLDLAAEQLQCARQLDASTKPMYEQNRSEMATESTIRAAQPSSAGPLPSSAGGSWRTPTPCASASRTAPTRSAPSATR
ncbi:hypothetical protein OG530_40390 [Streptomyces decoyicus]|uniref:hypothetical protein n=1 Tax=Streptomyces decoyicus TaxID=249567 RepID=UPI002E1896BF